MFSNKCVSFFILNIFISASIFSMTGAELTKKITSHDWKSILRAGGNHELDGVVTSAHRQMLDIQHSLNPGSITRTQHRQILDLFNRVISQAVELEQDQMLALLLTGFIITLGSANHRGK